MGVLKANVGGVWVPVSQGFSTAQVGLVGAASMSASTLPGIAAAPTDLPGVSVTWIADPTHTYRTTLEVGAVEQVTTTGFQMIEIGDAANVRLRGSSEMVQAGGRSSYHLSVVESGLSGPQTRKGRASTTSGTVTVYGTGNVPLCPRIVVEDITTVNPSTESVLQLVEHAIYTPTLGGMVVGTAGINVARYVFIGDTGVGSIGPMTIDSYIQFGTAGQTFPTNATIGLPSGFNFAGSDDVQGTSGEPGGGARMNVAGTVYYGALRISTLTAFRPVVLGVGATYATEVQTAPTIPAAWAAGNSIASLGTFLVRRV